MARAVRFYRMLGFEVIYGGGDAAFTSFRAGTSYLNLIAQPADDRQLIGGGTQSQSHIFEPSVLDPAGHPESGDLGI